MSVHGRPTSNPCPPWCELPAGHRYDQTTRAGDEQRIHEMTRHDLAVPGGTFSVQVLAEESLELDGDGLTLVQREPVVWLNVDRGAVDGEGASVDLCATQARRLGELLLAAAARLESVSESDPARPRT